MPDDLDRPTALQAALDLHIAIRDLGLRRGVSAADTVAADETAILSTAEHFLSWLRGPTQLSLTVGPVRDQTTGLPTGTPNTGVPMQIHDHEQFDLTLVLLDSEGSPTTSATPPVWTTTDDTVVPVNVSADGMTFSVIAGVPGSAVVQCDVTKDDGTVVSVTEAVDVVPGGVDTIALTEGPVSQQP